MRNGLFLGALLATLMVGGTALAERNDTDNKSNRGHSIKEQVLEKQKEGTKTSHNNVSSRADSKSGPSSRITQKRQNGEVYTDQATRSSSKSHASSGGKNLSATNSINNPSEIAAMLKMINPMTGAYETSQAPDGTDSYTSSSAMHSSPSSSFKSTNGKQRNLSATGAVNNPSEIKSLIHMLNPMKGAYNQCAAADGTDSYSNAESSYNNLMTGGDHAKRSVHFINDKGEVTNSMKADTSTAKKSKEIREQMSKNFASKMEKKLDKGTDVAKKSVEVKGQ